jgi:drug/metabolite transporter (DMT)-like permease
MFVVATFATAGHFTMTLAFAEAPVSITQPFVFLQLVWSVLTGAIFFAEPADGWVVLGGAVIVGATTFIAIREAMLRRSHKERPA